MAEQSAGLLPYRYSGQDLQFLLVHPGGPFWKNRDTGAWSIAKGEFGPDEEPLTAAVREFHEETGIELSGPYHSLSPITQRGGKRVLAWLVAADIDESTIKSNTFTMEWPPRSGKMAEFPEIDRAGWFDRNTALKKILAAQAPLIDEAHCILGG